MYAYFTGCTAATQLNGNVYQLANADTAQLVAVGTGLSDYSSTADSCTIEWQESSNPIPFYSSGGVMYGGNYIGYYSDSQAAGENPFAHTTTDFMAGAYSDGPEFGYGFRSQEHVYSQVESAQFIAESQGSGDLANFHTYSYKVGNPGNTPFWWVYPDGTNYTRSGYNIIASVSIGSCSLSTGPSDCTLVDSGAGFGPPTSESINIKICANGAVYDTFDWTQDGSTPSCASQHMLPTTSGTIVSDDMYMNWGAQTGHTVGATASIPVTVANATQLGASGGSYLASSALPTTAPPTPSTTTTGSSTWGYEVVQYWNGATAGHSTQAEVTNAAATLDSGHTVSIQMGNLTYGGAAICYLYRTASGGTPSTTGLIAGPVQCDSTVIDNGLAGDSSSPPSTNLTGHATLNDGYLISSTGLFYFPQITGSGCISIASGAVSSSAVSCSGGGGTPGSPSLSIQGNNAGSFAGIPATLFSATNGISQIENKGSAGITLDSTATDFSGGGTGPIVFKSAAKILGSDNSSTGIEFLEAGSGHIDLWATGAGGLSLDATGNGSGTGAGSGAIAEYSKAGIGLTDNSSTGITLTESGASSITFAGVVTASSTINAATGFKVGGAATSTHYLRGNGTNYVDSAIQAGDLPATVVLNNQSNTYGSGDIQIFGASTTSHASLNLPSGSAPTSPNSGDFWNLSGVLQYFDGSNTNSLVRIQGPVTNGHCPQFSGTAGVVNDSGAACGGGGGSSLFTSFQFASNTAMTGSGIYFQLVPGTGLTSTYTGAGTSGSPFIGTLTLGNPSATTLGGIESFAAQTHKWINTISTSGVPSATQPASTDLSDYGSALPCSLFSSANCSITIAGTSVSLGGATSSLPSPGIIGGTTPAAAHFTTGSFTGQITSTLSTGTAPFSITSTTVVPNLNVSQLLGNTWAIPGTIGSGTANTGAFTTLSASVAVSGTGFQLYLASPPAIGSGTPAGGTFTNLIATSSLSGVGVNVLLASPPAIGGSAPAAGTFTNLVATGVMDGHAPVTITTGSSASLGGTYSTGYTFNQNPTAATAITYTLPVAAAGKQYCVGNSDNSGTSDTGTVKVVTSAAGQYIHANGARSGSGGYIISAGAAGDKACFVGTTATDWEAYVQFGTWTLH
jgi:hypothetical protein